jgi:hypothetical protein
VSLRLAAWLAIAQAIAVSDQDSDWDVVGAVAVDADAMSTITVTLPVAAQLWKVWADVLRNTAELGARAAALVELSGAALVQYHPGGGAGARLLRRHLCGVDCAEALARLISEAVHKDVSDSTMAGSPGADDILLLRKLCGLVRAAASGSPQENLHLMSPRSRDRIAGAEEHWSTVVAALWQLVGSLVSKAAPISGGMDAAGAVDATSRRALRQAACAALQACLPLLTAATATRLREVLPRLYSWLPFSPGEGAGAADAADRRWVAPLLEWLGGGHEIPVP